MSFELFSALVGCITFSGVKRLSVCRGGVGSGGCCRPVGEVAIGLSGSGRELDVDVDGSRGGDVVRCCFVAGSATMSSVAFVCYTLLGQVRVVKAQVESNYSMTMSTKHGQLPWTFRHAAWTVNRYVIHSDG